MKFGKINYFHLLSSSPLVAFLRVTMSSLPNIEPIMLFTLSFSLVFGPISGFIFGFSTMFLSDFFMNMAGSWTLYTSVSYGMIGLISGFLGILKRRWNRKELTCLAFTMTILYDLITLIFFSFDFFIPLKFTLIAQIPFTLFHLSNCIFVFLFAPYIISFYSETKDFSIVKFLGKVKYF